MCSFQELWAFQSESTGPLLTSLLAFPFNQPLPQHGLSGNTPLQRPAEPQHHIGTFTRSRACPNSASVPQQDQSEGAPVNGRPQIPVPSLRDRRAAVPTAKPFSCFPDPDPNPLPLPHIKPSAQLSRAWTLAASSPGAPCTLGSRQPQAAPAPKCPRLRCLSHSAIVTLSAGPGPFLRGPNHSNLPEQTMSLSAAQDRTQILTVSSQPHV